MPKRLPPDSTRVGRYLTTLTWPGQVHYVWRWKNLSYRQEQKFTTSSNETVKQVSHQLTIYLQKSKVGFRIERKR